MERETKEVARASHSRDISSELQTEILIVLVSNDAWIFRGIKLTRGQMPDKTWVPKCRSMRILKRVWQPSHEQMRLTKRRSAIALPIFCGGDKQTNLA